jgi:hypothetical protein
MRCYPRAGRSVGEKAGRHSSTMPIPGADPNLTMLADDIDRWSAAGGPYHWDIQGSGTIAP